MTGPEYKAALKELGIPLMATKHYFGVSRRHSQKIAAGDYEVPFLLGKVVELLQRGLINKEDLCQTERKS